MNPIMLLGAALALSMLGNALLWHSRDSALERAATAESAHARTVADAKACTDGVRAIRQAEERRRAEVEAKVKAAESRARSAERRAQVTMQARPAVPGDACASAVALSRQKLQERRKAGAAP